jgi:thiamine-phosphate pyrophosphorylase
MSHPFAPRPFVRHALSEGDLPQRHADYLHLRAKHLSARELFQRALRMREAWPGKFIINDRIDIALAAQADGVHLPANRIPPALIKKRFGMKLIVGVSCHNLMEAQRAEQEGADYVFLSPIFAPRSKQFSGQPLGLDALSEAARIMRIPVIALGGICEKTEEKCRFSGASGIAAISFFFPLATPDQ